MLLAARRIVMGGSAKLFGPCAKLAPRAQTRGLLHLPALATVAKLGGAAAIKKVAISKVLQRIGPEKAIGEMRALNQKFKSAASGVPYSSELAEATEVSLTALERSLTSAKGDDRIQKLWAWWGDLEKKNPTLADAVLKTFLEALPGVRWANAILKGTPKPAIDSDAAPPQHESVAGLTAGSDEHAAVMLRRLQASHPEAFVDYHVLLIPRDKDTPSS